MTQEKTKNSKLLQKLPILIAIIATLMRIILKMNSPWRVYIRSGGADDWYQVLASISLLQGKWMGDYSWTTLSKGVSYPLFVAASKILNMPLGLTMGLFFTMTSAIATAAVFPIIEGAWSRCIVYVLLLYSPIFFASSSAQIYRNALIPVAALGVVSTVVAVYLRFTNIRSICLWTIIEALYLAFFWYLREDSVWLLPLCLAGSGITFIRVCISRKDLKICLGVFVMMCIPYLTVAVYTLGIKTINYHRYGLAVVNDRTDTAFADVMRLLYRIDDPDNKNSDIWITKKSIDAAFSVSPTLSSIEDTLRITRDSWAGGAENELVCDLFGWIMRLVADNEGLYSDAVEANEFYSKIYAELSEAFDEGVLSEKNAIFLSSQTGGYYPEDFLDTLTISLRAFVGVLGYNHCKWDIADVNREIDGDNNQIMQAEFLLDDTLNRSDNQLELMDDTVNYSEINSIVEKKRITNARISNIIIEGYIFFNRLFILVGIGIVLIFIRTKNNLLMFVKENAVWMIGIVLTAYLDVFMVTLYSLWNTRDPMSNVAQYYAPGAYMMTDYIKIIFFVWVMTKVIAIGIGTMKSRHV